ncbi:MAG: hypothetical protein ACOWWH_04560 [Eubacteriaceae bacterium]
MKAFIFSLIILTIIIIVCDIVAHFILFSNINILKDILISSSIVLGILISDSIDQKVKSKRN